MMKLMDCSGSKRRRAEPNCRFGLGRRGTRKSQRRVDADLWPPDSEIIAE